MGASWSASTPAPSSSPAEGDDGVLWSIERTGDDAHLVDGRDGDASDEGECTLDDDGEDTGGCEAASANDVLAQSAPPVHEVVSDIMLPRDFVFEMLTGNLSTRVSLREKMPPVYDSLGVPCTVAHAVAAACAYDRQLTIDPSRLYIYNCEWHLRDHATGASCIRLGCKAVRCYGVCSETHMPYSAGEAEDPPSDVACEKAYELAGFQYYRLRNDSIIELCKAIATGFPVLFHARVFAGMELAAKGGLVLEPWCNERCLGGVALLAVGYDDEMGLVTFRHCHGAGWGDGGYGYMTYRYMLEHTDSYWVLMSGSAAPAS